MKKSFYLDKANGKVFGVCSGLANHMNWDVTFVRVAVVLLTLITFPWGLLAYGAAAMIGKKRPVAGWNCPPTVPSPPYTRPRRPGRP